MSYASHKRHAKHPARISWGDTSYHEYQVYASTKEQMPYQSYHSSEYPNVEFISNKNYEDRLIDDAPRAEIVEFKYYPQIAKTTDKYQVNEDVDREAEDFIKFEHKKFARSNTWMSFKTG
ncbi:hypothetical protein COLO4_04825 [Corchorus olitorius]|uniref:Uncharacterized protein n=1 Tax=Corchorus olitorius TaxID=93759 RepID=A0A1R3KSP5_9ROSI|nr:hypothetical protein COLO4_04825 [Corchorus olitorius]